MTQTANRSESPDHLLVGHSPAIRAVVDTIRLIAPKRSTVLITGPTGTGKELAARMLHEGSPRRALAMVTVNCGAIPDNLFESELFGHVKGAFTGAIATRLGRFEQAHRSTLFLDEIGEMSFEMQAKLLRAIQEREFQRVGSSQTVRVDVRVIAATNCDLAAKVRHGEFREDLYYRLNVVPIAMPPLGDHLEDVPLLIDHVLAKLEQSELLPRKQLSAAALGRLLEPDHATLATCSFDGGSTTVSCTKDLTIETWFHADSTNGLSGWVISGIQSVGFSSVPNNPTFYVESVNVRQ